MTITAFLAAMPGVDYRILHDVGIDADGHVLDQDDPRVRRRAMRRPFLSRMLELVRMGDTMLPGPRVASRFLRA